MDESKMEEALCVAKAGSDLKKFRQWRNPGRVERLCDRMIIYVSYTINIHFIQRAFMGIVKITEQMHTNLRLSSGAMSRSINSQAEHWLRVGMMAELNPGLCYNEICQKLREAEQQARAEDERREITLALEKP